MKKFAFIIPLLVFINFLGCKKENPCETFYEINSWEIGANQTEFSQNFTNGDCEKIEINFENGSFCIVAFGVEIEIIKGGEIVFKATTYNIETISTLLIPNENYTLNMKVVANLDSNLDCVWLGIMNCELNY